MNGKATKSMGSEKLALTSQKILSFHRAGEGEDTKRFRVRRTEKKEKKNTRTTRTEIKS